MIGFHDFVGNLTEKIDNALVDSMLLMFYQMSEENPIIFEDVAWWLGWKFLVEDSEYFVQF